MNLEKKSSLDDEILGAGWVHEREADNNDSPLSDPAVLKHSPMCTVGRVPTCVLCVYAALAMQVTWILTYACTWERGRINVSIASGVSVRTLN